MATKSRSCRPSAAGEAASLSAKPLNLGVVMRRFKSPRHGAVVAFLGVVRDSERGSPIRSIAYEAYQSMAERELGRIKSEARTRWPVEITVSHRTGKVAAGEPSLIVAARGSHRREAFEACQFVVEQIKARAAIWKVEYEWGA
ncbi:MAG: molybdenum cofactor biosynthesis protein MoaE [Elusimicrobia bacterium]|nr:molybdenum cofactor biosynthesis protein MoaE [Elusimicrobiota bacterium]